MGFRDKMQNFMSGRYGMDEFGRFLNMVSMGFLVVSIVISFTLGTPWLFIPWGISLLIIGYSYFRILSRNFGARNAENQWYCNLRYRNQGGYSQRGGYNNYNSYGGNSYNNSYGSMTNEQKKAMDRRTHKIFKCPNCAQKIRVPKGKGKICIKCPTCRIEFIKKT